MTPRGKSQQDARMRREGFNDGYALLPAKRKEAEYQRAWRRGRAARIALDTADYWRRAYITQDVW